MVQPENTRPAFTYTAMSLIYRHVYRVVVVVIVVVMSSRPPYTGKQKKSSGGQIPRVQPWMLDPQLCCLAQITDLFILKEIDVHSCN